MLNVSFLFEKKTLQINYCLQSWIPSKCHAYNVTANVYNDQYHFKFKIDFYFFLPTFEIVLLSITSISVECFQYFVNIWSLKYIALNRTFSSISVHNGTLNRQAASLEILKKTADKTLNKCQLFFVDDDM